MNNVGNEEDAQVEGVSSELVFEAQERAFEAAGRPVGETLAEARA